MCISERDTWDGNFFGDSIDIFAWAVHLGKVLLWKMDRDTSAAGPGFTFGHHQ